MANKLNLPSYESLLQSGEQARDNGAEKVVTIPIDQIRDFEGHPLQSLIFLQLIPMKTIY